MAAVAELFRRVRAEGRAALLPFMTAGVPSPEASPRLFAAMAAGGADGLEVGIPYSDPLMDGPVIQEASRAAIAAGASLDTSLAVLGRVVSETGLPTLAMSYANPVLRRGVDRFCATLAEAGAGGLIVPDLPVEESAPLRKAAARRGLGVVSFVAPTSGRDRIEAVAAADPLFVYAVAEMGVTGEREEGGAHAAELVERVRAVTDAPIVLGVGVSTPEQARRAAEAGADGVIVGSVLVRRVLEAGNADSAAKELEAAVSALAEALR